MAKCSETHETNPMDFHLPMRICLYLKTFICLRISMVILEKKIQFQLLTSENSVDWITGSC